MLQDELICLFNHSFLAYGNSTNTHIYISSKNRVEAHIDIILRPPRFSSIERFLVCGGGTPFEMYNRMMEKIFPKDSYVPNILDDLKSKATTNLKASRTINELNGLFGLHDRIGNKTYTGVSDLVYWMNGSLDLHNIVEFPISVDKLIHDGDKRKFNFFESMYPSNIRMDAENGLPSAFQFWSLPKTRKRFDELLDEFVFEYKDSSNNPEHTFNANTFGIVSMMRAIINLQKTILSCSEGIYDKECFVDNTLLKLRSMDKEERFNSYDGIEKHVTGSLCSIGVHQVIISGRVKLGIFYSRETTI